MSKQIEKYCKVVLEVGINIKECDNIYIKCPAKDFIYAQKLTELCYKYGASHVKVDFYDELLNTTCINAESVSQLSKIDLDVIGLDKELCSGFYKTITIVSPQFELTPTNSKNSIVVTREKLKVAGEYRKLSSEDHVAWCICAVPNDSWAKKVLGEENVDELESMIYKTMRLDNENPVEEWNLHVEKLQKVSSKLNSSRFEQLHITTGLGTDVIIKLPNIHLWKTAGEKFVANLPTEEIYTMPSKYEVEGVVVTSKPLIYNNQQFDKLSCKFENGKVVSIEGEKGKELLNILQNVDGGTYLGEIALVDKHSTINNLGKVMFNTLFDENAGSHIAFGNSFPSNLMESEVEKDSLDFMNKSDIHIDIVFGTDDIHVDALTKIGESCNVMEAGEFTI